jgi:hypothetical protein
MKRQPKAPKPRRQTIQVWSYAQARAAVPYITSVVRSLREHALEVATHRAEARRLDAKPGRPDRATLISIQHANEEARLADERLQGAIDELEHLDIYVLDPFRGQALVPFVHDEQLAWYIFDLFDNQPFRFWRFQSDPDDTRRPVTAAQQTEPHATGLA